MESLHTQSALVFKDTDPPLSLGSVDTPQPTPGSVVVRVLTTTVSPNALRVYSNSMSGIKTPEPPFTPSSPAVGRVHELGPDATVLSQGQLVFIHTHIHSRDDPDVSFLQGYIGSPTSAGSVLQSKAAGWSNGTFAEYARVPLENVFPLDEELLIGPSPT